MKRKNIKTDGINAELLQHLKSPAEYLNEALDVAIKESELIKKHEKDLKDGKMPKELEKLLVRSSELVLLIESTKAMRK